MTTKYARGGTSLLTSGTVTPLPELAEADQTNEEDTLIRKMDKKHVRFLAPSSDEEGAAKPKISGAL
jgi:hypothetical protein